MCICSSFLLLHKVLLYKRGLYQRVILVRQSHCTIESIIESYAFVDDTVSYCLETLHSKWNMLLYHVNACFFF